MKTKIIKTRVFLLTICFLAYSFGAINAQEVFEANDVVSLNTAINAVNAGNGGDIIKITGDITIGDWTWVNSIKQDVTITSDVNSDGKPKYLIKSISTTSSITVFDVFPKKYFTIENISVTGAYRAVWVFSQWNDTILNREIKVKNCVFNGNEFRPLYISGNNTTHYNITVSDSEFSNNAGPNPNLGGGMGLHIDDIYKGTITIRNCVANNNIGNYPGIEISAGSFNNNLKCYIYDCTANNNSSGISVRAKETTIKNCVANGNQYNGFSINEGRNLISDCVAENNGSGGFRFVTTHIVNCIAKQNREFGFYSNGNSIFNGCVATGTELNQYQNGGDGFRCSEGDIIFNSTATCNKGRGVYGGSQVINFTASNNAIGIRNSGNYINVYNSICYDNSVADLYNNYSNSFQVYNTVSKLNHEFGLDFYGNEQMHNCSSEDPKLQGKTANGNNTNNPDDLVYYALGEGSSALNLADKNLIIREKLLETIDIWYDEFEGISNLEDILWFENIMTEEYIANLLMYDQTGNIRAFDSDRYDAGSVAKNLAGKYSIANYTPKKAANVGKTSVTFYGIGFHDQMNISLKKQGESNIINEKFQLESNTKCKATFEIDKKSVGKWDIVFDFGDEIITIKDGFEIEPLIVGEIEAEILGSQNIRVGGWTTYTVKYTNTGNANVYLQPIIIEFITRKDIKVEVRERWEYIYTEGSYTDKYATIDGVVHRLDTTHHILYPNKYSTYITPLLPVVPPYHKGYLTFDVQFQVEGIVDEQIEILVHTFPPLIDRETVEDNLKSGRNMALFWECMASAAESAAGIGWELAKTALGIIPGVGCALQIGESVYVSANAQIEDGKERVLHTVGETAKIALACVTSIIPLGTVAKTVVQVIQVGTTAASIARHGANMGATLSTCAKLAGIDPSLLSSFDPNDKCGPVNQFGSTFFTDRDEFTYVINFENSEEATAPAAEVRIIDELDLNVYDINTFEVGNIGFGSRLIKTPLEQQNYKWTVDMSPEMNLITEIELTLNKSTGTATWYFKSIDPETGELPDDALMGFLPPNDEDGSGQGFVMFTIKLKNGLADDVVIKNKASIVFDNNPPIITDEWINKKDIVPPTSSMLKPVETDANTIELKWSGTDNSGGSGVYYYNIYGKRNNDEYELLFANTLQTSAPFTIEENIVYSFYSLATDYAGNEEIKTNIPDITFPEPKLGTVTLIANPTAGGNPNGGGTFEIGTSITVNANENTGYNFVNWTEGGNEVNKNANYTLIVNGNRTLTANYTVKESEYLAVMPVAEKKGKNCLITWGGSVTSSNNQQGTSNNETFDKRITGYTVYRLKSGQTQEIWDRLQRNLPAHSYIDKDWSSLGEGKYQYAITINFHGGDESNAVLSNVVEKDGKKSKEIEGIADENYQLYPNPFKDEIFVGIQISDYPISDIRHQTFDYQSADLSIQIFNAIGQKLMDVKFDGAPISTSGLPYGVYYVVVISKSDTKSVFKMIKN